MIQTKVARILSDTQVVLAAGSEQGVKEGMLFVLYELSDHISDPETGDDLGQLEIIKGKVRVFQTQEKVSLAATLENTINPSVYQISPFRRVRLHVDESAVTALDVDTKVKVGDLARCIE